MDPLERITWLRSNALPGAEILCGEHNTTPMSIFHERYEVVAGLKGLAGWHYRGRIGIVHACSLGLMEPGELHTTTCVYEPADFFNLFISPELFQQTAEEQGIHGQVHFQFPKIFTDPMLLHAIRGLVNAIRVFETPLEQQSWLALCLQGMQAYSERVPLVPSGRNDGSAIKVAKAHLQERYQDPVDLEQLSALTGLSRFSLVHSFSRQVGMPPHAFQTHVRIEKARALLEVGIPPAMVAADVGFFDQSHLNRHFKRIM